MLHLDLYREDQKKSVNGIYPEEKALMLMYGVHLASANIHMNSITQSNHLDARHVGVEALYQIFVASTVI